jgi:asparagine synthetase B (glutamine-hydrolysing)
VPMLALSRAVSDDGLRIALSGEGADELHFGYDYYKAGQSAAESKRPMWSQIETVFCDRSQAAARSHDAWAFLQSLRASDESRIAARNVDVATKLSRYLLASQGDRVSMANTVEQRFPFLDARLWQMFSSLPEGEDKLILRNSMSGRLPDGIRSRPKRGYFAPAYVGEGELAAADLESLLQREHFDTHEIFSYDQTASLWQRGPDFEVKQMTMLLCASTHILLDHIREWQQASQLTSTITGAEFRSLGVEGPRRFDSAEIPSGCTS